VLYHCHPHLGAHMRKCVVQIVTPGSMLLQKIVRTVRSVALSRNMRMSDKGWHARVRGVQVRTYGGDSFFRAISMNYLNGCTLIYGSIKRAGLTLRHSRSRPESALKTVQRVSSCMVPDGHMMVFVLYAYCCTATYTSLL
jgi:hypothetical protein